ncbi:ABC transporter permease [Tumebacillus flagellatus]|uniref:ABC transporter permease n=1 Tax=Tumebacillus flagellatus TaxID=1157490 RepID=A0A074LPT0_9BACL|nr:ABC transporter permease subunit [Tumebacillus flagellatus]KEO84111.1 ABC transporter permease [Tumebacillus flagellatus]
MHVWIIARREMQLGFRNPWSYSFLLLFSVFSLAMLLIQSNNSMGLQGYTHATGMMINLTLYLLPMMTLLLGSFSLTGEKEDGSWHLLSTYSVSTSAYLIGKYLGLTAVLLAIVATGFGLFGVVGVLLGQSVTLTGLLTFLLFSVAVLVLYLGLALVVGAIAQNRWQALTYGVGIWFITVLAWPTLLIAVLNLLPYPAIKPTLGLLTLLNPAELVRVVTVIKLGGGAVFGPEYYQWIDWIHGKWGTVSALVFALLWLNGCVGAASWIWERGRGRG